MIGLAEQLKRLGQLAANVRDEAMRMDARDPRSGLAAEVAEWVTVATSVLGGLAIDLTPPLHIYVDHLPGEGAPDAPAEEVTRRIETPSNEELMAELDQHAEAGQR